MDYHLNQKVVLNQDSKYPSLYTWSLQEQDDSGVQVGLDQVPFDWTLTFTAVEIVLNQELGLEVANPFFAEDGEEEKIVTKENEYIFARLRPGYFADPDRGSRYSMFGTNRTIKSFSIWIRKREDEKNPERCSAWGSLSRTCEIDFQNEEFEDTLQFDLNVSAARFSQYVKMIKTASVHVMTLRLGRVDGLYSEWSPSITAEQIKVLTNLKDHQVTIPEGCQIKPPTLGRVDKFNISFLFRNTLDKPTSEIESKDEKMSGSLGINSISRHEEDLVLQRAALSLAAQQEKRLKSLTYAVWLIAGLFVISLLHR